tara:strand:+ start:2095 stop:2718 length:624 start_codon:yes stop_codon:yes gene_type:complete
MRFVDPMKDTPEGKLLSIVRDIEKQLGIEKNTECMGCKSSEGETCSECGKDRMKKASKPDYLDFDGDGNKEEPMKDALRQKKGKKELKKYVQEPNVENVKPRYVEISGSTEIPAHGPNYNQVIPYMEDGPKKSIVSETYKMPAFAKTGYGLDGTGIHLKLNDGGTGGSMYRDKVEEALATIKKESTVGQQGVVSEIAGLIENIYSRL